MTRAFVGLGSNLEDPARQLDVALAALSSLQASRLLACSPRYWTEPVGDPDQPEFLNAAAALETDLEADELLAEMHVIERDQDRRRDPARPFGPRTIDLDLLMYGTESIETPGLTVPHPRLHERAFVLRPLADLAPELVVPGRGPIRQLLARIDSGGVRPADLGGSPQRLRSGDAENR